MSSVELTSARQPGAKGGPASSASLRASQGTFKPEYASIFVHEYSASISCNIAAQKAYAFLGLVVLELLLVAPSDRKNFGLLKARFELGECLPMPLHRPFIATLLPNTASRQSRR